MRRNYVTHFDNDPEMKEIIFKRLESEKPGRLEYSLLILFCIVCAILLLFQFANVIRLIK